MIVTESRTARLPAATPARIPAVAGRLTERRRGAGLGIAVLLAVGAPAQAVPAAAALRQALRGTQASAVVLEIRNGRVLARWGVPRRGAPGSTLKPLLLAYALDHGIVSAGTEVYCRRELHVGNRDLACTHPRDRTVFTAESALAESCNTWFAELARRFSGPDLEAALAGVHVPHARMDAADVTQRQLAVLGLDGVSTSPLELARAYRGLLRLPTRGGPVSRGLAESVNVGMASPAAVPGLNILGKTGTASDHGQRWTHGWFAGGIPGRWVLVIYVPRGDGGTAARLARQFFRVIGPGGEPQ